MIAIITAWVKGIILVVLFASFLELLLPNSNMQRFIRVIMGLFIMLAILNPFIDIIQSRWGNDHVVALSTSINNSSQATDIVSAVASVSGERERLSYEMYKRDLAKQIKAMVMAVDGVADAKVIVDVNTGGANPAGSIKKIMVYVMPGISPGEKKVTKVPPVSIGSKAATEQSQAGQEDLNPELKEKITRTIAELYQLPKEQISIQKLF